MYKGNRWLFYLRDRWPFRLAILVVYLPVIGRYLFMEDPQTRFLGMMPTPMERSVSPVPFDMVSFAFLTVGLLAALGQPTAYLLEDDWMAYIRKPRGWNRYLRYLGFTVGYCLLFSLPQLILQLLVKGNGHLLVVIEGFACATWTVFLLMLVVCMAALAGNAVVGYMVCLIFAFLYSSLAPVQSLLMSRAPLSLPVWAILYAIVTVGLFFVDYRMFKRCEIL